MQFFCRLLFGPGNPYWTCEGSSWIYCRGETVLYKRKSFSYLLIYFVVNLGYCLFVLFCLFVCLFVLLIVSITSRDSTRKELGKSWLQSAKVARKWVLWYPLFSVYLFVYLFIYYLFLVLRCFELFFIIAW